LASGGLISRMAVCMWGWVLRWGGRAGGEGSIDGGREPDRNGRVRSMCAGGQAGS
jgi:hypothetical protein